MSRDQVLDSRIIENYDQLIAHFRSGEIHPSKRSVGTEHEKFVFRRDNHQMLAFEEPGGFSDLFTQLVKRFGWEADYDGPNIVALTKNGAAITLEPGGQFELSGAILKTIFETETEYDNHIREVKEVAGERIAMTIWGTNPFFSPEEVPWMPKSRYGIMRRYMPKRGDLGLYMMKTTCTIQGNYDYTSEADAADIIRTALLVSPIVSAIFANSPLSERKDTGMKSFRGEIWTRTDNDRSGFPAFMYRDDWGYNDYLQYVLDVPMYFIRRDGEGYIDLTQNRLTFREFIENGHGEHRATMGDFELHLSTLFPEVRMKTYIEVRGCDAGPREAVLALPAIWKGIFYHEPSRKAAAQLFAGVTPEQHREVFLDAYKDGINAQTAFGSMQELAKKLIVIASTGLDAIAAENDHPTEAVFLEPLVEIAETGIGFADRLLKDFQEVGLDNPADLISRWEI